MKITIAAILTASTAILTAGANANPLFDTYAGVTIAAGGASIFDDGHTKSTSAQSFGGVVGIDIPFVRAEAEYSYLNQSDMNINMAAINAYAKMPTTVIQPYIGAGVGMTFDGEFSNNDALTIKHGAAYQGMLGLTFSVPVLPIKVDAEARTVYIPKIYEYATSAPKTETADLVQYEARLKLRYIF